MRTSASGRAALMRREGVRLKAYPDVKGIWTIGVGHTAGAGLPAPCPGMRITQGECDAILQRDLRLFEAAVARAISRPMTQNQFDACVSLAFNIGAAGFERSSVARRFNEGDVAGAADAFLLWCKPAVLKRRRGDERAQFLRPDPVASPRDEPAPPPSIPKTSSPQATPSPARGVAPFLAALFARWIRRAAPRGPRL